MNILYLDDNSNDSKSISDLIKENYQDVTLLKAKTINIAEKLLINTIPDLLISHVILPDMNGYKLIQKFKMLFPDKPVMAIVSYKEEADIIDAEYIVYRHIEYSQQLDFLHNLISKNNHISAFEYI